MSIGDFAKRENKSCAVWRPAEKDMPDKNSREWKELYFSLSHFIFCWTWNISRIFILPFAEGKKPNVCLKKVSNLPAWKCPDSSALHCFPQERRTWVSPNTYLQLLTVECAAGIMEVATATVWNWVRCGRIVSAERHRKNAWSKFEKRDCMKVSSRNRKWSRINVDRIVQEKP